MHRGSQHICNFMLCCTVITSCFQTALMMRISGLMMFKKAVILSELWKVCTECIQLHSKYISVKQSAKLPFFIVSVHFWWHHKLVYCFLTLGKRCSAFSFFFFFFKFSHPRSQKHHVPIQFWDDFRFKLAQPSALLLFSHALLKSAIISAGRTDSQIILSTFHLPNFFICITFYLRLK